MTADAIDRAGQQAGIVVDARSGGRLDGSERRSPRAYQADPVVIALRAALREIGTIRAAEWAERRANMTLVEGGGGEGGR